MENNGFTIEELEEKAVNLAISKNWQEAVKINLLILEKDKDNSDALNRLGCAYINLKELTKAKKYFKKALEIDPLDNIAGRNLKLLKSKEKQHANIAPANFDLEQTIKEPSKNHVQKTKPYIKHL